MGIFNWKISEMPEMDADAPLPETNIRSATGMSRAAMARWLAANGLFGHESSLGADEQAVLRCKLGAVPGLPAPAPARGPQRIDGRLQALARFAAQVIGADGRVTAGQAAALRAAGYGEAAVWEAIRVLRTVRDVFGLPPQPAAGDARLATRIPAVYPRAA